MSKKSKSQASAAGARAASAALGSAPSSFAFGSPSSKGFHTALSSLSYIAEQPDLNSVSDGSLVVTLRNLGKKDSTTKAKALEELQEYVSSSASGKTLDAGLLEAWVRYPPGPLIHQLTIAIDQPVPSDLDRQRSKSAPACSYSSRLPHNTCRETYCPTFAQGDRSMVVWCLRQ